MDCFKKVLGVFAMASTANAVHNILDYGAVPDLEDPVTEKNNANAIEAAFAAANEDPLDREVLIPGGYTFSSLYINGSNVHDLTFTIDGTLLCSKNFELFPLEPGASGHGDQDLIDFLTMDDIENVLIRGDGVVDGQGYLWWQREYVRKNPWNARPHLFQMYRGRNVEITGVKWQNAAMFHMKHNDCDNIYYHDFEIYVDVWGQLNIGKLFGIEKWDVKIPTFPLNTDGIDPSGSNILIERIKITNFDDAVAVKPAHNTNKIAKCAENIIARDLEIHYGLGATIGSVSPSNNYACVRNITFSNITFFNPVKAVYVKTNPGTTNSMLPGSGGEITNVLYENLTIHFPVWWNIYIGPQQQKQPGGDGPGCMLYPFGDCESQPLISVHNITLRNIESHAGFLPPGVIRCNATNPCHGFVIDNVKIHGWWRLFGLNYLSESVHGTVTNSFPIPPFENLAPEEREPVFDPIVAAYDEIKAIIDHVLDQLFTPIPNEFENEDDREERHHGKHHGHDDKHHGKKSFFHKMKRSFRDFVEQALDIDWDF